MLLVSLPSEKRSSAKVNTVAPFVAPNMAPFFISVTGVNPNSHNSLFSDAKKALHLEHLAKKYSVVYRASLSPFRGVFIGS